MTTLKEHLLSRSCDPDNYHVIVDEESNTATFLLYSLTGKLLGYQQYKPDAPKKIGKDVKPSEAKYFTYSTDPRFTQVLFGIETWTGQPYLYVTEGIFDACKLHALGLPAVAILSSASLIARDQFRAMNVTTIGVLDGDEAGLTLSKICDTVYQCPHGKDPGDMSLSELADLLNLPCPTISS